VLVGVVQSLASQIVRYGRLAQYRFQGRVRRFKETFADFRRGFRERTKGKVIRIFLVGYAILIAPLALRIYLYAFELSGSNSTEFKDALLSLGAIIGAPFIVWRTLIARQQADVSQQTHLTELFTKAIEQLGAEKETLNEADISIRIPNLEVRIGAILALDRIANDSPKDYWRVIEVLSAYIRNNTRRGTHAPTLDPPTRANILNVMASNEQKIQVWLLSVLQPSTDIQLAIDVLGRRNPAGINYEKDLKLRVDLSGANLRKVKFSRWYNDERGASDSVFVNIDFSSAQLDGCHMVCADLSGCVFERASMVGTNCLGAKFRRSRIHEAKIDGATFTGAEMLEVDVQACSGIGAIFNEAVLTGGGFANNGFEASDFESVIAKKAFFVGNRLVGANLQRIDFVGAYFSLNNLEAARLYGANFLRLDNSLGPNNIDASGALR
jgi:uncharacterized protein YjbI with pentapeptide repeats